MALKSNSNGWVIGLTRLVEALIVHPSRWRRGTTPQPADLYGEKRQLNDELRYSALPSSWLTLLEVLRYSRLSLHLRLASSFTCSCSLFHFYCKSIILHGWKRVSSSEFLVSSLSSRTTARPYTSHLKLLPTKMPAYICSHWIHSDIWRSHSTIRSWKAQVNPCVIS